MNCGKGLMKAMGKNIEGNKKEERKEIWKKEKVKPRKVMGGNLNKELFAQTEGQTDLYTFRAASLLKMNFFIKLYKTLPVYGLPYDFTYKVLNKLYLFWEKS